MALFFARIIPSVQRWTKKEFGYCWQEKSQMRPRKRNYKNWSGSFRKIPSCHFKLKFSWPSGIRLERHLPQDRPAHRDERNAVFAIRAAGG